MTLLEQASIILKEMRRNPVQVAMTIMVVALIGLMVGSLLPRKYQSSTTVVVDERKIIAPLLEGTTVPTNARDRAWMAEEILFSRSVLRDILEHGGWLAEDKSPVEVERMMDQIKRRTEIENVGRNLIRIAYTDEIPERAFKVTLRFADLFLTEGREAKQRESSQAFAFISGEVARYQSKLKESEDRLNQFLARNGNIRPGTGASVDQQVDDLRSRIRNIEMDLAEARIRERSLVKQLSSEQATTASITREAQLRTRLQEQYSELENLRLNYREDYPDIVSTRHKIQTLESQLAEELDRRLEGNMRNVSEEGGIGFNPLHQELRSDLARVRTEIAGLETRQRETRNWLESEYQRGNQIAETEAEAAELTRDYEVNRAIYQDLLRHRESARIAMNLDEQGEGMSMAIQEPAALPLRPYGLRLLHFALLSPLLGAAIAGGIIFLRVRLDGRIRSSDGITEGLGIPVLATVPTMQDDMSRSRKRHAWILAITGLLVVFLGYAVVGTLRLMNVM